MTIEDAKQSNNIAHLDENIAKIDELTQRLTKALTLRKPPNPQIAAPESELFARAATAYWQEWMQNPAKILEHQVDYWGKSLKHIVEAQQLLAQGKLAAPEDNTPDDKRFSNPVWKSNPYFNFIKQQYMINSDAIKQAVEDIEDIDEKEKIWGP